MSNLLDATRSLKPLQQGECDYLCGVYAVINAIRLASYPDEVDAQELFDAAIDHLIAKDRLADVMRYGMGTAVWRRLLRNLVKHPALPRSLSALPVPLGSSPTGHILRDRLSYGAPLLLELSGHCQHITVATHITRTRLVLFDSDRMQWILQSSMSSNETQQPRYTIVSGGLIRLKMAG